MSNRIMLNNNNNYYDLIEEGCLLYYVNNQLEVRGTHIIYNRPISPLTIILDNNQIQILNHYGEHTLWKLLRYTPNNIVLELIEDGESWFDYCYRIWEKVEVIPLGSR